MSDNTTHQPIIVVDTDAVIDLSPWEQLAKDRDWDSFFSHIPDAKPRDNGLADLLELALADDCWVAYSSRWDVKHRDAVQDWLRDNGFPRSALYLRKTANHSPVSVAHRHVQAVANAAKGKRPVFMIHNHNDIAAALRRCGVAALGVSQVPRSVKEFRAILRHARPVAVATRPEVTDREPSK